MSGKLTNLVERLNTAATHCDEQQEWHGNSIDGDCEPHWSSQTEMIEAAKACREAATAIATLQGELARLRGIVERDPSTVMIAFEDGDHQRLSRAADAAIARAETAEERLAEAMKALEPFAEAITRYEAKWDEETGGQDREPDGEMVSYLGWLGDYFDLVPLGAFRAARRARSRMEPDNGT